MALTVAPPLLPDPIGSINDYGQTLERAERERLKEIIAALEGHGLALVYLASWRDPFGNPSVYAHEVFRAWRLPPEAVLVVLLRVEGAGWRAVAQLGGKAQEAIPAGPWEDLLARAEVEANRGRTASAVLKLAQGLLELVTTGPARTKEEGRTLGIWPYVVVGVGSAAGVVFFIVRRVCPRCLRPLRRRESLGGIMWVCPRCRYTRAPVRWGRRPGGRGGVYP